MPPPYRPPRSSGASGAVAPHQSSLPELPVADRSRCKAPPPLQAAGVAKQSSQPQPRSPPAEPAVKCFDEIVALHSPWKLFSVNGSVLFCCAALPSFLLGTQGLHGSSKVRGVNLGGWLVIEGWIKPSLFDDISNGDMLDGTEVQFKSVTLQKYISAENRGGSDVTVDKDTPLSWETFRLWRVSESIFQFRSTQGQFLSCNDNGGNVTATVQSPSDSETFYVERNYNNRVHIKLKNGGYLQASKDNQLIANYPGTPGWDDNAATFQMTIASNNYHRNIS
nr:probable glucan 1,3-beta-glucosidase A isoform X1 [Ipomoea batatas]